MCKSHDPLCSTAWLESLSPRCSQCLLIDEARQSALNSALAAIRYEFPKPTLGIKKVMAIIEAYIHD